MPFIYELEDDIRYSQGMEKGIEIASKITSKKVLNRALKKATRDKNRAFVKCLLLSTDHDDLTISTIATVPIDFVINVRKSLHRSTSGN